MKTPEEFWKKVEKTDDHWIWKGGKTNGYGVVRWNSKVTYARHVAWEIVKGYRSDMVVSTCGNKLCVRPEHLKDPRPTKGWLVDERTKKTATKMAAEVIAEKNEAIRVALEEIDRHQRDYHHRTSDDTIEKIKVAFALKLEDGKA